MRIIVEHYNKLPYNSTNIVAGVCLTSNQCVEALRRAGHTVTYLVPDTSKVNASEGFVTCSRWDWWQVLDKLSNSHDVVILNSSITTKLLEYPNLIKKLLVIDHYLRTNFIERDTTLGRRCISVTVDEEPIEHTGRLINQVVPFDRAELADVDPKLVIAVGRNSPEKRLDITARAMNVLTGLGYTCKIYTDKHSYFNGFKGEVIEAAPHTEIMKAMAKAVCLIQLSKQEMNGSCVAFESASHGTPVIHTIDNADYFLKPSGCSIKVNGDKHPDLLVTDIIDAVKNIVPNDRLATRTWYDNNYSENFFVKRLEYWLQRVVSP